MRTCLTFFPLFLDIFLISLCLFSFPLPRSPCLSFFFLISLYVSLSTWMNSCMNKVVEFFSCETEWQKSSDREKNKKESEKERMREKECLSLTGSLLMCCHSSQKFLVQGKTWIVDGCETEKERERKERRKEESIIGWEQVSRHGPESCQVWTSCFMSRISSLTFLLNFILFLFLPFLFPHFLPFSSLLFLLVLTDMFILFVPSSQISCDPSQETSREGRDWNEEGR